MLFARTFDYLLGNEVKRSDTQSVREGFVESQLGDDSVEEINRRIKGTLQIGGSRLYQLIPQITLFSEVHQERHQLFQSLPLCMHYIILYYIFLLSEREREREREGEREEKGNILLISRIELYTLLQVRTYQSHAA